MRFSKRTAWITEENDLSRRHRERLAAGDRIIDLTSSNPTRAGFEYSAHLLNPLSDPKALDYGPDPRGLASARQAVCEYYADHGATLDVEQILLTTSTSEAYGYLFKLLCDPEDRILALEPSYPLFDFLAGAEAIGLDKVSLVYEPDWEYGWQLDLEGLRSKICSATRAILLVHPNNPTGHFTRLGESEALGTICREHGLALIVDEVFLDYRLDGEVAEALDLIGEGSFVARDLGVPVFVVSGISKICGLPQMKVAWLAACGPGWQEAMTRLEVLADTYLSMNAPVQNALPHWLSSRVEIRDQIRRRVGENLRELDAQIASQRSRMVSRLSVEGGWYATLRVPALEPDHQTVIELLDSGVWVQPGYFFGMPGAGWLVLSLLTELREFSGGISILLEYFEGHQGSNHFG